MTVSLDEIPDAIQCSVLDVHGSVGRLAYRHELPPRVIGRLALGTSGYLVFDDLGIPVGLRVVVRASPPDLRVAVLDGVALPERRAGERIPLVIRALIDTRPPHDADRGAPWTETINLSERGALLRNHPALTGRLRFSLGLMFGDDPVPIAAEVRVARRSRQGVGISFEAITDADATRLNGYLAGIRQRRRHASHN